jgi:hypothetical protein
VPVLYSLCHTPLTPHTKHSFVRTDGLHKGFESLLLSAIRANIGKRGFGEQGVGGLSAKSLDKLGSYFGVDDCFYVHVAFSLMQVGCPDLPDVLLLLKSDRHIDDHLGPLTRR